MCSIGISFPVHISNAAAPWNLSLIHICLGVVLGAGSLGLSTPTAMMIAFLITAAWWLLSSLPMLKNYKQKYYAESAGGHVVSDSFRRLGHTFREIGREKQVLFFLIAFFFYIDGVYTIIDMATAYGQALGLDSTGLLLALLLTQIVAFPCALLFGRISAKYNPATLISICIEMCIRDRSLYHRFFRHINKLLLHVLPPFPYMLLLCPAFYLHYPQIRFA